MTHCISRHFPRRFYFIALGTGATLSVLLSGCAVGPNFQRPAPPKVKTYTSVSVTPELQPAQGEPAQHLVSGRAVPGDWWRLFRSPALDALVDKALAANPTVAVAQATLAQAQQVVRQAQGAYAPQVDVNAAAERQKGPPFALGIRPDHTLPTFNLYSVGATASFVPDVFGLTARQVERQQALAENRAYQLAAAQVSVAGNVVSKMLRLASARQQIDVVKALVADDKQTLALVRQRQTVGKVASTAVWTAQAQLDEDQALLPPLRQQAATAEDALAALLGQPPAAWAPPALTLDEITLPAELPLSLPSSLVRQRPDILAAEARLHAASAAVGVADARMYPRFTLSASTGTAALTTESFGNGSNLVWTLLGGLTAPIFHGGALTAQKQAAADHFHAELALYRNTVLRGLGQVADLLRALGHDAQLAAARRGAWEAARATLRLQQLSYVNGKISRLDWLDSDRAARRAHQTYVQARTQRYLDSAGLMVALGGGWPPSTGASHPPEPTKAREAALSARHPSLHH